VGTRLAIFDPVSTRPWKWCGVWGHSANASQSRVVLVGEKHEGEKRWGWLVSGPSERTLSCCARACLSFCTCVRKSGLRSLGLRALDSSDVRSTGGGNSHTEMLSNDA
jgi:hypothetical protein